MAGLKRRSTKKYPIRTMFAYPFPHSQFITPSPKVPIKFTQALFRDFELKYAKAESTNTEKLLAHSGFMLVTSTKGSEVKLVKEVDGKVLEISYQTNEGIDPELREEGNGDSKIEFTATVKSKDDKMTFTCIISKGELDIIDINYIDNIDDKESEESYSTTDDIEESVKGKHLRCLKDLGITKEIIEYIRVTGIDEEQKNYMNWLQEIKGCIG